jgi:hypothetical protein
MNMDMWLGGSRQITEDVSVLHVRWRMVGQWAGGARAESEPREGIWTWVVRLDDRLEIVASHNSDMLAVPWNHPLAGKIRAVPAPGDLSDS